MKETADGSPQLSSSERSVLAIFRDYLMTQGQMLCLNAVTCQSLRLPLQELTSRGLLVAETYPGGFSLTACGYAAMKRVQQSPKRQRPR